MSRLSRILGKVKRRVRFEEEEIKYGYYSAQAVNQGLGAVVYTDPRYGNEVLCTVVTTDPMGREYLWDDKEFRGPVDKFVRRVGVEDPFMSF